jgi:hypothetical protein
LADFTEATQAKRLLQNVTNAFGERGWRDKISKK